MSDIAHLVIALAISAGIILVCIAVAVGIILLASKHPGMFADMAPRIVERIVKRDG